MNKTIVALTFLVATTVTSYAKQVSFLCVTLDKKTYIDVVSTGGTTALVQISGGDFLEAEAQFVDPTLYIYVPLTNGIFALAYNVKTQEAGYAARLGDTKQAEKLVCKFRE